jgi:nucleoside-diphosphate-sugar epimerase
MNILLTGGTGYIGSAVIAELVGAGHRVTALSRSPDKAADLARLGAEPLAGELHDPDSYREAAISADGIVHAAFDYATSVRGDATAVDALLAAARGRRCVLAYTSGCWVLGDTGEGFADEGAATDRPAELVTWRAGHERRVLEASTDQLSTAVIRPGIVYGGPGGLTAPMFETATNEGAAEVVGDGSNHWSLVHRDDVARLYRAVLEEGASGIFHAVDDAPLTVGEVAAAASRAAGAGGTTRGVPLEQARERFGPMADALCLDQRLAAVRSHELGWQAARSSFVDEATSAHREWVDAQGA